ncbi:MAG TPA: alpha/beta hydrolase [Ramlibacter sp.]|nr:alpha/beta hydrolase [Ramlibacter sp.]
MQQWVDVDAAGRRLRIEYEWVGTNDAATPLLVFLHEGLGSVALWRDFPTRLCEAAGARGLVYSRPGYGRSTPRPADEQWRPDFMHVQAREVLPALLRALAIRDRPWLFGHSDGASIALLYAATFPDALQGAIVLAPHILVEDVSVASIRQAREAYLGTDLRPKLARFHDDVDSAFWGWNDIWLDPAFRDWAIEGELTAIRCPLLAVQGLDDEYGTLEQVRGIARRVPGTRLLELPQCRHSPHRDQPQAVIAATVDFLRGCR